MDKKASIEKSIQGLVEDHRTVLRAAVSLIPTVGGAIDHLVFDRYDEIRMRNIETAIHSISTQIHSMSESMLVKEWFESLEALNAFKTIIEAVQCEHEEGKIAELSRLFPIAGTIRFADDPLKVSILAHLSQMTDRSIKMLRLFAGLQPQQRKFNNGVLEAEMSAVWLEQIVDALKSNSTLQFWKGKLNVDVEMQILESKNVVQHVVSSVSPDRGYRITALGLKASEYLTFQ